MILIFDLDDTLYDESSYVKSGFRAVSDWVQHKGWAASDACYQWMMGALERDGRGRVFDDMLKHYAVYNRRNLHLALQTYRQHRPDIQLYPEAQKVLKHYAAYPKHLVTDGNKAVQQRKIEALHIEPLFHKVWITHRFGIRHAKPSLYCFEKIRSMEGCDFSDMVYIGDNPTKDFVNLKKAGMHTVRVLTGHHRDVVVPPGYEAGIRIPSIGHFPVHALEKNP